MNGKKWFFGLIVILAVAGLFFVLRNQKAEAPIQWKESDRGEIVPLTEKLQEDSRVVIEGKKEIISENKIPSKFLISVPFTSQAPFGKWDVYHEEACEEASLIMVQYFLQNQKITPEIAESEIQKMIAYQIKNYGDYMDSSAEEMVKLAFDFYGLKNLKVSYDFSKEELKKELAKGNPIIIPAAGQLLGNPNFTPPGPLYHALVLKGYDGNTIITNDPGTKRGEGYQYDINTLFNAIHDFSGDKKMIDFGRKAMIVIEGKN